MYEWVGRLKVGRTTVTFDNEAKGTVQAWIQEQLKKLLLTFTGIKGMLPLLIESPSYIDKEKIIK